MSNGWFPSSWLGDWALDDDRQQQHAQPPESPIKHSASSPTFASADGVGAAGSSAWTGKPSAAAVRNSALEETSSSQRDTPVEQLGPYGNRFFISPRRPRPVVVPARRTHGGSSDDEWNGEVGGRCGQGVSGQLETAGRSHNPPSSGLHRSASSPSALSASGSFGGGGWVGYGGARGAGVGHGNQFAPALPKPPPTLPLAHELAAHGHLSGHMYKLGTRVRKWKRRFFVLKPTTFLYYYLSSADREPAGVVDLDVFTECLDVSWDEEEKEGRGGENEGPASPSSSSSSAASPLSPLPPLPRSVAARGSPEPGAPHYPHGGRSERRRSQVLGWSPSCSFGTGGDSGSAEYLKSATVAGGAGGRTLRLRRPDTGEEVVLHCAAGALASLGQDASRRVSCEGTDGKRDEGGDLWRRALQPSERFQGLRRRVAELEAKGREQALALEESERARRESEHERRECEGRYDAARRRWQEDRRERRGLVASLARALIALQDSRREGECPKGLQNEEGKGAGDAPRQTWYAMDDKEVEEGILDGGLPSCEQGSSSGGPSDTRSLRRLLAAAQALAAAQEKDRAQRFALDSRLAAAEAKAARRGRKLAAFRQRHTADALALAAAAADAQRQEEDHRTLVARLSAQLRSSQATARSASQRAAGAAVRAAAAAAAEADASVSSRLITQPPSASDVPRDASGGESAAAATAAAAESTTTTALAVPFVKPSDEGVWALTAAASAAAATAAAMAVKATAPFAMQASAMAAVLPPWSDTEAADGFQGLPRVAEEDAEAREEREQRELDEEEGGEEDDPWDRGARLRFRRALRRRITMALDAASGCEHAVGPGVPLGAAAAGSAFTAATTERRSSDQVQSTVPLRGSGDPLEDFRMRGALRLAALRSNHMLNEERQRQHNEALACSAQAEAPTPRRREGGETSAGLSSSSSSAAAANSLAKTAAGGERGAAGGRSGGNGGGLFLGGLLGSLGGFDDRLFRSASASQAPASGAAEDPRVPRASEFTAAAEAETPKATTITEFGTFTYEVVYGGGVGVRPVPDRRLPVRPGRDPVLPCGCRFVASERRTITFLQQRATSPRSSPSSSPAGVAHGKAAAAAAAATATVEVVYVRIAGGAGESGEGSAWRKRGHCGDEAEGAAGGWQEAVEEWLTQAPSQGGGGPRLPAGLPPGAVDGWVFESTSTAGGGAVRNGSGGGGRGLPVAVPILVRGPIAHLETTKAAPFGPQGPPLPCAVEGAADATGGGRVEKEKTERAARIKVEEAEQEQEGEEEGHEKKASVAAVKSTGAAASARADPCLSWEVVFHTARIGLQFAAGPLASPQPPPLLGGHEKERVAEEEGWGPVVVVSRAAQPDEGPAAPASQHAPMRGDVLVSCNGSSLEGLPVDQVASLLRKATVRPLTLGFRRGHSAAAAAAQEETPTRRSRKDNRTAEDTSLSSGLSFLLSNF